MNIHPCVSRARHDGAAEGVTESWSHAICSPNITALIFPLTIGYFSIMATEFFCTYNWIG